MSHQSITCYQVSGRKTWAVTFNHPSKGRRNRNLGTENETEAKAKALDIERIVNDPTLWDATPDDKRLEKFDPRAVQAFFDFEPVLPRPKIEITDEQQQALQHLIEQIPKVKLPAVLAGAKTKISVVSEEHGNLRKELAEVQRRNAELERDVKDLTEENKGYRRRLNKHCTATFTQATNEFKKHYKGRAEHTTGEVTATLENFAAFTRGGKKLGEFLLGDIRPIHINNWIADYKGRGEDAEGVGQSTRAKCRRYLSTFWTWAHRHYDLSENPIEKSVPIAGQAPEHIVAIRRYEDLKAYIDALEPWPYWQAWVAFALLTGPRFNEQAHIKTSDVLFSSNYVRIATRASGKKPVHGTKTGKERNVPIERTILLPILKKHVQTLDTGRPWLFPSVAPPPMDEDLDRGGLWRNETFLVYWRGRKAMKRKKAHIGIAQLAKERAKSDAEYWGYTQMDWRRCAATAMGHSGMSALQIAQYIGDSEDIARRHYIAPVGAEPWPLKYHEVV